MTDAHGRFTKIGQKPDLNANDKKATGSFVIGSRVKAGLERAFWDGWAL